MESKKKKRYKLIYIQNRKRPTDIENKLMVTKGESWVGDIENKLMVTKGESWVGERDKLGVWD